MNQNHNRSFPIKEIDEALGIKPKGEEFYLFKNHSKLSIAKISEVEKRLIGLVNSNLMNGAELESIKEWLKNFKVEIPKSFDVKVLNQIELPKNISIDNLPESFEVNEPKWLEKIYSPIINQLKEIEPLDLERYTDPKNPIAVRLSNGKRFIEAIERMTQVVQGSTIDQETKDILNAILSAIGSIAPGAVGIPKAFHNEITGVPATETLIVAYSVPASKSFTLQNVYGSSGTDGLWILYVNSVEKWKGRNAWTDRNVFSNLIIPATSSQTIELKVTNQKNINHLFSGGFYGTEL